MAPTTNQPDPTRSAAARAGHERRARRKRLARMTGAALRRLAPEVLAQEAERLQHEPEAFAEWIIGLAADAAAEWDEPDLVGGSPTAHEPEPISIHELRSIADDLLGLEAQGDVDATVEITEEQTEER